MDKDWVDTVQRPWGWLTGQLVMLLIPQSNCCSPLGPHRLPRCLFSNLRIQASQCNFFYFKANVFRVVLPRHGEAGYQRLGRVDLRNQRRPVGPLSSLQVFIDANFLNIILAMALKGFNSYFLIRSPIRKCASIKFFSTEVIMHCSLGPRSRSATSLLL